MLDSLAPMLGGLRRFMAFLPFLFLHFLLTSGQLRWALVLVRYRCRHPWRRLLDEPWGRWWRVPAAILPGCIGLVTIAGEGWQPIVRASIVATLLLATAVFLIYGQDRENRERIKTDNQREQRDLEQRKRDLEKSEQTDLVIDLLSEITRKIR